MRKGPAHEVGVHIWLGHIQNRGHIHIEANKGHFLCCNTGKMKSTLFRVETSPDSFIPGELSEREFQSGYPASFLINSQKEGETAVFH